MKKRYQLSFDMMTHYNSDLGNYDAWTGNYDDNGKLLTMSEYYTFSMETDYNMIPLSKYNLVYNKTNLGYVWMKILNLDVLEKLENSTLAAFMLNADRTIMDVAKKVHRETWDTEEWEDQFYQLNYIRKDFNEKIKNHINKGTHDFEGHGLRTPINIIDFFHPAEICYSPSEYKALKKQARKKGILLTDVYSSIEGFKFKSNKEVVELSMQLSRKLYDKNIRERSPNILSRVLTKKAFQEITTICFAEEYVCYRKMIENYESKKEVS
tara:strand:- start:170 stop:970 length:801 start_codon:yes stop_codon:yes gene_type:complete